MKTRVVGKRYFPSEIPIAGEMWQRLDLDTATEKPAAPDGAQPMLFYRRVADRLNRLPGRGGLAVPPSELILFAQMNRIFRYLLNRYLDEQHPLLEDSILAARRLAYTAVPLSAVIRSFSELYPAADVLARRATTAREYLAKDDRRCGKRRQVTRELLLLLLTGENPALDPFRDLFDDGKLAEASPYGKVMTALDTELEKAPPCDPFDLPILELLRAPLRACPDSLSGQLEFIRKTWTTLLPPEMLDEILSVLDIKKEEMRARSNGPGPPVVLEFRRTQEEGEPLSGGEYPEPEKFSADTAWMPNVVLIAKMVYVWLDQLSRKYGRPLSRLDEIPDAELDNLAAWGFTGLWLIGVWERSPASGKIKQYCGNPEAIASAYSLYDYVVASDLGGDDALENLRRRASQRGIRLASDMVPNHTGIDSRWTREHPDWFVQLDYPPFPAYRFTGPDLSSSPDISLRIEDGYWSRTDAAVVFQHVDNRSGRVRYIYHGNDGTSTPWNDTAQLNYLIPELRETVIRTILHVARNFPIIRFDAAMTLAKKHYQRLWFPQIGLGGGIPSRAEHALSRRRFDELFPVEFWREVVDRVAAEAPDTLLLAEAFWLMEGYFVRTLGMHRVYNSAFMNMLKMEENAKYRQTIKNVLEFNPEILQRFVNFMNNPDEKTAIEQFGREGKYFGAALLLVTMPGLPMFGHGQIEGFTEKYGMEYRRAYWTEEPDRHLIEMHEREIFPLMKKRRLFSGAANFVLYDFFAGDRVDENVFAYSNSHGDERALIVFHNRFASTSGWIRTSCSRTVKDGSGGTRQVRTTLAEALAARSDGRYYYRFRDEATGLEYLRHGRDLQERGLYVELEAYEYHAFIDFREIRDDDYGTWGRVCAELGGRPVESLEDEVRQIRHAGVLAALRSLVSVMPDLLPSLFEPSSPETSRDEAVETLRKSLTSFFSALKQDSGFPSDDEGKAADLALREMETIREIAGLKSRRAGAKPALELLKSLLSPEKGWNVLLLGVFLILRRSGNLTNETEADTRRPVEVFSELGFGRVLAGSLRGAAVNYPHLLSPWGSEIDIHILKILLEQGTFFAEREGEEQEVRTKALLSRPDVRDFLLVNESGGAEWFNKERFEALVRLLFLSAVIVASHAKVSGEQASSVIHIHRAARKLIDDAERAGYRTDIFQQLSASA
jgi:glycosidase